MRTRHRMGRSTTAQVNLATPSTKRLAALDLASALRALLVPCLRGHTASQAQHRACQARAEGGRAVSGPHSLRKELKQHVVCAYWVKRHGM